MGMCKIEFLAKRQRCVILEVFSICCYHAFKLRCFGATPTSIAIIDFIATLNRYNCFTFYHIASIESNLLSPNRVSLKKTDLVSRFNRKQLCIIPQHKTRF